jgi:hypothetical protein
VHTIYLPCPENWPAQGEKTVGSAQSTPGAMIGGSEVGDPGSHGQIILKIHVGSKVRPWLLGGPTVSTIPVQCGRARVLVHLIAKTKQPSQPSLASPSPVLRSETSTTHWCPKCRMEGLTVMLPGEISGWMWMLGNLTL